MEEGDQSFRREDPWRIFRIMAEFVDSFETMSNVGPAITIFGSARTPPADPYYKATQQLARELVRHEFAVVTGGGPGVMEAANRGAAEAKGTSVGLNITLPHEQQPNRWSNVKVDFHYFFARKVCLVKHSMGFVFMPGGFGTLDEFFEVLTLVQTQRMQQVPLILFGRPFWQGMLRWAKQTLEPAGLISPGDTDLVSVTDKVEEALEWLLDYRLKAGPPKRVPRAFR